VFITGLEEACFRIRTVSVKMVGWMKNALDVRGDPPRTAQIVFEFCASACCTGK